MWGTTVEPLVQCADSIDNDGDGSTDYPADPGCTVAQDNNERDSPPLGQNNFNPPLPRIGVITFCEVNIPQVIWKDKVLIVSRYWYPAIAQKMKSAYPDKIVLAANILFKQPTTLVTDIIIDNVAHNMTTPGQNPAMHNGTWAQQAMGQLGADTTLGYALLYGWDEYGSPYAKSSQANATPPRIDPPSGLQATMTYMNGALIRLRTPKAPACSDVQAHFSGMTCSGWQGTVNQAAHTGR